MDLYNEKMQKQHSIALIVELMRLNSGIELLVRN